MSLLRMVLMPDAHAKPFWYKKRNRDGNRDKLLLPMDIANRRFDWAASFVESQIEDLRPGEKLVFLIGGDFGDMPSLSSYDKGKVPAENQRIDLDIKYTQDAMERLLGRLRAFVDDYNAKLKRGKRRKPVEVEFIYLLGNHENRWARHRKAEPLWDTYEQLPDDIARAGEYGATVVPFLQWYEIERVFFSHYWYKKDSRYAISGVMPARALTLFLMESAVSFHTHEWNVWGITTPCGTKKGLYAGCYYEHEEDYPGPQGHANTWKGLTVLYNVSNGNYTERRFSLDEIKEMYYEESQGPYNWEELFVEEEPSNGDA